FVFFFSSRRRHTRFSRDWSSDVCSSDLYRGEIKVALLNTDADEPYDVAVGDRIAQLIVMPVPRVSFVPVTELPDSVRGDGGFGSTGYQHGTAQRTEDRA